MHGIMKVLYLFIAVLCTCTISRAATNYVSLSGSHTTPFDTWAKSATNIHDAVALAGDNDTVLVSNGTLCGFSSREDTVVAGT